ncbi:GntR family transcriptional regulator [Latilactobacillus sakei]|uniref:GntR family transcriptional regulator n=1 Tax=Latilactobacillus sakei TaxID=1599 RepID=UPI003F52BD47
MEYKEISPATLGEERLRYDIQKGIFNNLSERELADQYGISRTAMRRSLSVLKNEGLIEKKPRVGMTVNRKHIINMLAMSSMSAELNSDELQTEVLQEDVTVGEDITHFLKSKHVFELSRRRIINEKPISYELSFLSDVRFPGIDQISFQNRSLYQCLKDQYGVILGYGHETIKAGYADKKQASILEIPEKTPLYVVTSLAYDHDDEPIEYSVQYLVGNQIRYRLDAKNIFDYHEDGDL